MRVALTGGSGFLGQALSARLLAAGARVCWLSHAPEAACGKVPAGIAVRGYDQLRPDDEWDALINLAGAPIADRRWSAARKQRLLQSRLVPTQALLDWLATTHRKPRVLLSGSATGWYGNQGDVLLDERSGFHDEFAHRLCAQWEEAALCAQQHGVPVALLRTGVVLHPSGGMLARLALPFRMGLGGRLGDGRQYLSWIALQDWVAAVLWLLHAHLDGAEGDAAQALTGPVNLTAPVPVTNAQFTRAYAAACARPALLPVPAALLRLGLGELATLLLDGQRVLPTRLGEAGFAFRFATLEAALAAEATA
ncbi:TIGR01777 family protein [Corticibacter populi]|uniref:TIGR01777 family protein n=1 Tax=Corticibacter populi TaxID=1550736 RepID=A0A3M6QTX0_9BURK|nr:TIGR01777 family oxidoreductase [Corticibacter populi]RMX06474.1 TIGR01777 family protein [Corticibacter populi]RZS31969.1 hypothetical protein EV687_2651 [Corticibacter populi]